MACWTTTVVKVVATRWLSHGPEASATPKMVAWWTATVVTVAAVGWLSQMATSAHTQMQLLPD
eukprot:1850830-Amphidinium_carterae.1